MGSPLDKIAEAIEHTTEDARDDDSRASGYDTGDYAGRRDARLVEIGTLLRQALDDLVDRADGMAP